MIFERPSPPPARSTLQRSDESRPLSEGALVEENLRAGSFFFQRSARRRTEVNPNPFRHVSSIFSSIMLWKLHRERKGEILSSGLCQYLI